MKQKHTQEAIDFAAQFGMRPWTPEDKLGPFPGPFQRAISDDRGRDYIVTVGGNN